MKTKSAVLLICGTLFCSGIVHDVQAQSHAAILSLLISTSPEANAMGETYGNTFRTSPMGSRYNPAGAGLFAEDNFFGYSSYPEKTAWLSSLVDGLSIDAESMAFGVNLARFTRIPVSVGLSTHRMKYDMMSDLDENNVHSEGEYHLGDAWEEIKGTTLAFAYDGAVRAAIGMTWKINKSHTEFIGAGLDTSRFYETEADVRDYGFIVEAPLLELLLKRKNVGSGTGRPWRPFLHAGLYVTEANVGEKVHYPELQAEDLLPRRLSVGMQWNAGLRYKGKREGFNIIALHWSREVEDELIRHKKDFSVEYTTVFNDIKPWEHVFMGHADKSVTVKSGLELNLADFYFIREGRYEDRGGALVFNTEGWGIDYTQPFRILSELMGWNDHLAVRLITCIRFETHYARYGSESYTLRGTEFKSHVVRLNNFPIGDVF